ncbi:hypothetical protein ACVJBD_006976 [Rhizobium mongolense]
MFLGTLMIPQVMLVIPLFLVVSKLGWVNTYHGMILPVAFGSFGTFLLRQFFLGIRKDLDEAAMIDGASRRRILVTIIVPLAMPAIGLLALFAFMGQWNSFLWPLIVTNGMEKATLPLGLTLFQTQQGTSWNYIMAGSDLDAAGHLPGDRAAEGDLSGHHHRLRLRRTLILPILRQNQIACSPSPEAHHLVANVMIWLLRPLPRPELCICLPDSHRMNAAKQASR